jgi:hypothetical protein
MRPIGFLCATLLIAACGTEPSPNIVGAWALTSSTSGGTFACTVSASLVIEASEASVTGTLMQNQASCTDAGQPIPIVTQTRSIVGELDGRDITFTTQIPRDSGDCAYSVFDGRATAEDMSGVVETRPVFCQGTFVQMRGTWEAQRQ